MNRNRICEIIMVGTDILLLIGVFYIIFIFVNLHLAYKIALSFIISIIYFFLVKDRYGEECLIEK